MIGCEEPLDRSVGGSVESLDTGFPEAGIFKKWFRRKEIWKILFVSLKLTAPSSQFTHIWMQHGYQT